MHPWGKVKHVPEINVDLVSVSSIWRQFGWSTTFEDDARVTDRAGTLIARAEKKGCLYHVVETFVDASEREDSTQGAFLATSDRHARLLELHYKFGHAGMGILKCLERKGLVQLSKEERKLKKINCPSCILGKFTRKSFPKTPAPCTTTRKLERVHADLSGKMRTPSKICGSKYYLLLVDDFTRIKWIYLLQHKSQVAEKFAHFLKTVVAGEGLQMGCLRTDGGTEFLNQKMQELLDSAGIKREVTGRYSPEQNPVAERGNRTVGEMVRTWLTHSGLPEEWWGPATLYAAYVSNRLPNQTLKGKSAYELWSGGHPPNYSLLQPFGARAYAHVPDGLRTKWDTKAVRGIFIGVSAERRCYCIWDPAAQHVIYTLQADIKMVFLGPVSWYLGIKIFPRTNHEGFNIAIPALRRLLQAVQRLL